MRLAESILSAAKRTLKVSKFLHTSHCADRSFLEVWFAGAHTDVGGGSVKNGERYSLARISLRWMIRQCFKCDTGE